MNHILLCIILLFSLPLHVEDISLLHLTSPESQDNDKQDEGLSTQDALPDNLGQQDDAIPLAGGEEDPQAPEMDPASNTPQVMSFNLSSAETVNDSEHFESPPKPEQLKQIAQPGTLYQSDGSAPGSDDLEREKRSPKFDPLSNGDMCLLSGSSGEVYYDYTDATAGLQCQCELCLPGRILERNCTCDRSTVDILQRTECRLVEQGKQFMPVHNKCTTGIDCKTCPYPWIVKTECSATSDTECECGSEGYSVDGNDCIPIPRCDVDHEPRFGDGEQHNVMVCQRCEEGYSQPKSNSTDKCLKIPDPTENGAPTTTGISSKSQDISTSSEAFLVSITTMAPTQCPANPQVTSDDRTDVTGTSKEPTLVTGDAIYCLTWKISIIVGVSILAVGIFIGIVAHHLYIQKYYDLTPKAVVSKDDRSGVELDGVVTHRGDNNNPTGDEVNIDEPTSSSPLNASSPDSGRGRGKGRNKRTGKISQARKRGGHGGKN